MDAVPRKCLQLASVHKQLACSLPASRCYFNMPTQPCQRRGLPAFPTQHGSYAVNGSAPLHCPLRLTSIRPRPSRLPPACSWNPFKQHHHHRKTPLTDPTSSPAADPSGPSSTPNSADSNPSNAAVGPGLPPSTVDTAPTTTDPPAASQQSEAGGALSAAAAPPQPVGAAARGSVSFRAAPAYAAGGDDDAVDESLEEPALPAGSEAAAVDAPQDSWAGAAAPHGQEWGHMDASDGTNWLGRVAFGAVLLGAAALSVVLGRSAGALHEAQLKARGAGQVPVAAAEPRPAPPAADTVVAAHPDATPAAARPSMDADSSTGTRLQDFQQDDRGIIASLPGPAAPAAVSPTSTAVLDAPRSSEMFAAQRNTSTPGAAQPNQRDGSETAASAAGENASRAERGGLTVSTDEEVGTGSSRPTAVGDDSGKRGGSGRNSVAGAAASDNGGSSSAGAPGGAGAGQNEVSQSSRDAAPSPMQAELFAQQGASDTLDPEEVARRSAKRLEAQSLLLSAHQRLAAQGRLAGRPPHKPGPNTGATLKTKVDVQTQTEPAAAAPSPDVPESSTSSAPKQSSSTPPSVDSTPNRGDRQTTNPPSAAAATAGKDAAEPNSQAGTDGLSASLSEDAGVGSETESSMAVAPAASAVPAQPQAAAKPRQPGPGKLRLGTWGGRSPQGAAADSRSRQQSPGVAGNSSAKRSGPTAADNVGNETNPTPPGQLDLQRQQGSDVERRGSRLEGGAEAAAAPLPPLPTLQGKVEWAVDPRAVPMPQGVSLDALRQRAILAGRAAKAASSAAQRATAYSSAASSAAASATSAAERAATSAAELQSAVESGSQEAVQAAAQRVDAALKAAREAEQKAAYAAAHAVAHQDAASSQAALSKCAASLPKASATSSASDTTAPSSSSAPSSGGAPAAGRGQTVGEAAVQLRSAAGAGAVAARRAMFAGQTGLYRAQNGAAAAGRAVLAALSGVWLWLQHAWAWLRAASRSAYLQASRPFMK